MKDYKVESLTYYPKFTLDKNEIAKRSKVEIQTKLDEYARNGYKLVSTNSTSYGSAMYIYLYFEREI